MFGQRVLTNWKEFELDLNSRQDVIPIRELGLDGISGWVREKDIFDFISGPYLQINFNNGKWMLTNV